MEFLAYLAIMVIGGLIVAATAPKPPKQKPFALEDFDVPTAEVGRPIGWVFGTRKVKDPNFIWYGDPEVRTKTKNGVKARLYRLGIHCEICIGPIDNVTRIDYGEKTCWTGEVTASEQITISQPNLYGGRDREGGIDGDFDLCFGEADQAVNDYLLAQIGAPLSAFRDSFCIVGRRPSLVANSQYIKPLTPTLRCILAGWPDDTPWYPETAIIPVPTSDTETALYTAIMAHSPAIFARFEEPLLGRANLSTGVGLNGIVNYGSGPDGLYLAGGWPAAALVPDGTQAVQLYNAGSATSIQFPDNAAYNYDEHDRITLLVKLKTDSDYRSTANHYLYHQGDHNIYGIAGLGVYLSVGVTDKINVIYKTPSDLGGAFHGASVDLPYNLENDTAYFLCVQLARSGGIYGTGFVDVHVGCNATHAGRTDFPNYSVAGLSSTVAVRIGAAGQSTLDVLPLHATIDNFAILTAGLTTEEITALAAAFCGSGGEDMNPAHIIRKAWVDRHQGMAEDPASIDDDAMRAAADTFYAEGLGFSFYWRNQAPIREFVSEVLRHAGAVQSINLETGALKIIPLRDDYDADALDLITEDHVLEVVEWQDAADGESVNQISVVFEYHDGTKGSVPWSNRASVARHGIIAETRQYPGVTNPVTAKRIAKRDVKQSSSNLSRGKLKVNRYGWDKFPGDVFKFSHGPEGIDQLIVRVMEIDTGTLTEQTITLMVVQDVFSLSASITDVGQQDGEWTAPDATPAAATAQDVMEAPYWQLLAELGPAYVAALADAGGWMIPLAAQPTSIALGFDCWPTIPPGGSWESSTDLPFTPCAELTAALARDGTTITWATVGAITPDAEVDDFVLIGTGASAEICRLTAFGSGTASLSRGMLDTTPQEHASGARVWFLSSEPEDWPRDRYAWISWAPGSMKLLTRTPSGVLDASDATAITVTPSERHVRPYPPGDIQIGGQSWPTAPLDGTVAITWAHRDRATQGSTVVLQDDTTDYGPEAGTTYNVWAYDDTDDTLLDSDTALAVATWTPTITISTRVRIEIEAARDGFESWQRQVRIFDYIATSPILTEASDYLLTEAGDYLITET